MSNPISKQELELVSIPGKQIADLMGQKLKKMI
jgi:hypothetical protein